MNSIRKLHLNKSWTTDEPNTHIEFDFVSKRTCMLKSECAHWMAHASMCDVRRTVREWACGACMQCIVHGLYVCAPLCTCSAVAHFGLHANCAWHRFCLCLEIEGARGESNSQNVFDIPNAYCLQFIHWFWNNPSREPTSKTFEDSCLTWLDT